MKKLILAFVLPLFIGITLKGHTETILFNAIEKSGSVFIAHKLAKGLNKQVMYVTTNEPQKYGLPYYMGGLEYIVESKLCSAMRHHPVIREHLFPTKENLDLIKKFGLKMIFHVRDLRQRIVSFAHYKRKQIAANHPEAIASYKKYAPNPHTLTLNDLIEIHIHGLPGIVKRIRDWLDVYKSGEIPMLITSFEDFHDNEKLFFEKILSFYHIPLHKFQNAHIPKNATYHFRKGLKDEWRETLTLDQQRRINAQIPEDFFTFFDWEE